MAKTGVEEHEAIKIWVVGIEMPRFVEGVIVLNIGTDLHLMADAVFDDRAERVGRCALW